MLKKRKPSRQTSFLMPTLNEQCDPRHPLRKLGEGIPWSDFEEAFGEYYSEEGRPAKPVRLMVGLLMLKQIYHRERRGCGGTLGGESLLAAVLRDERFSMGTALRFERSHPFGKGWGARGSLNPGCLGPDAPSEPKRAKWSSTAPCRKNVTYPLDTKQYRKIVVRCWKLADKSGVRLRRRYRKEVRECIMAQRFARIRAGERPPAAATGGCAPSREP